MEISISKEALCLLKHLNDQGWEAYLVGGCVRDCVLGLTPDDWDITTSALPHQIKSALSGMRILDTGLKHGTVTAILDGKAFEITTYRTDGIYLDHRRPEQVSFTHSLKEDLARRDFTMNAMAYHPTYGIVDVFGGLDDLSHKTIRCVGTPAKRLQEDALRILRALRFASKLGFSIESTTAHAILKYKELLSVIAAERLQNELKKLLCGPYCATVFREFSGICFELFPEISPMLECQQNHPYHIYSVWEHTLHALEAIEPQLLLRLAMLFHDSGKPFTKTTDENGIDHFRGHAQHSVRVANNILHRLKFDRHTHEQTLKLIQYHDLPLTPTLPWVKRQLNRFGPETFLQLLSIHRADILAQHPSLKHRLAIVEQCRGLMEQILEQQQCFSLRHLAVNGHDLLSYGIPAGKQIGQILHQLLEAVIHGSCSNTKEDLLQYLCDHLQ